MSSNRRLPLGSWHPASPLPASWQYGERIRQWRRKRKYGCGCAVSHRRMEVSR